MRSRDKKYTDGFKKILIELYNSSKPVVELCSEYCVTSATLYKWFKNPPTNELKKPMVKIDTKPKAVDKDKELLKLQKENQRIKEETEILKKAIAMFAKE